MPARNLDFVIVDNGGEPLLISVEDFDPDNHKVWEGDAPAGINVTRNKTADFIPEKPAPKKAAKK